MSGKVHADARGTNFDSPGTATTRKKVTKLPRASRRAAKLRQDSLHGELVLTSKQFDNFFACMTSPKEPTAMIKEGADLLRRLRAQSR